MFYKIKNAIRRFTPYRVKQFLSYDPLFDQTKVSFAINGEDLLLDSFLKSKNNGSFVDVGAHHPHKLSNTYYFYRKGWRGINIDPSNSAIECFDELRNEDINVAEAVGSNNAELTFYEFDKAAVNTFNESYLEANSKHSKLLSTRKLTPVRLESILIDIWPEGKVIDFLSLDVEGHELSVLHSNNWEKHKFKFIIVEIFGSDFSEMISSPIVKYLTNLGYEIRGGNVNNLVFELPIITTE